METIPNQPGNGRQDEEGERSGSKEEEQSCLVMEEKCIYFPNGGRARGREGRGTVKRFIQ